MTGASGLVRAAGERTVGNAATNLVVTAKERAADGVAHLTIEHPEGKRLPPWTPGAHIDVVLPNGLTRQYSLCGDRWDAYRYRIGVLREPSSRGGSQYVHDVLEVGDHVGLGGPRNHFHLVPATEYVFIAGGIGITPILPMVHQAELQGIPWTLHYGGRSRSSMAFLDVLEAYGDKVRVQPADEVGTIDLASALELRGAGARVYSCGPGGLLGAIESMSGEWPSFAVRSERFVANALTPPTRTEPYSVELRRSGTRFQVDPSSSLLQAIRSSGAEVVSSCTAGTCGTCEVSVLFGTPDHRDSVLSERERACNDRMLVCVSGSSSDELVLDL